MVKISRICQIDEHFGSWATISFNLLYFHLLLASVGVTAAAEKPFWHKWKVVRRQDQVNCSWHKLLTAHSSVSLHLETKCECGSWEIDLLNTGLELSKTFHTRKNGLNRTFNVSNKWWQIQEGNNIKSPRPYFNSLSTSSINLGTFFRGLYWLSDMFS